MSSYNTSVECSRCGTAIPKTLAVRTHRCTVCGLVLDRDHNAAINILKKGLEILKNSKNIYDIKAAYNVKNNLPQELREYTPVEISKRSLKQEEATNKFGGSSRKFHVVT